ncbi:unnamed protein product, partial [Rotaria magnacalcarata]
MGIPLMIMYLVNAGDLLAFLFVKYYSIIRHFVSRIIRQQSQRLGLQTKLPFEITHQIVQRQVAIKAILSVLVLYIVAGAVLFSNWEGWSYIDAAYFSFITFSTICLGDLVPGKGTLTDNENGKSILCALYLLYGLVLTTMCFKLVQDDLFSIKRRILTRLGFDTQHHHYHYRQSFDDRRYLLIGKSARYAWRRRICRSCPKILFELLVPAICILLLCLLRWIHTPSPKTDNQQQTSDDIKTSRIHLSPSSIISQQESIEIFNYTSVYRCPPSSIPIQIVSNDSFNRFKRLCPRSQFILSSFKSSVGNLILNTSLKTHTIGYRCRYDNQYWCKNSLDNEQDSSEIQHPSSYLCSHKNVQNSNKLLQAYLAIESLLNSPSKKHQLVIFTWPCSSYESDALFSMAPRFMSIMIFILIDGCILFSFNFLFQELIHEKHQGITELLRLLSIRPLLNSLAWFLRVFLVQLITSVFLISILKISFDGG